MTQKDESAIQDVAMIAIFTASVDWALATFILIGSCFAIKYLFPSNDGS